MNVNRVFILSASEIRKLRGFILNWKDTQSRIYTCVYIYIYIYIFFFAKIASGSEWYIFCKNYKTSKMAIFFSKIWWNDLNPVRPYGGTEYCSELLNILAILSRHATFCITRILGSYNHIFMLLYLKNWKCHSRVTVSGHPGVTKSGPDRD